jgi:putative ATPase
MDLFAEQEQAALRGAQPLAVRMRPADLDQFVGQETLLGPGKLLRRLVEGECLTSAIFWGPPGCGKTTLAYLIARRGQAAFETLHAAEAGVRDVRSVSDAARERLMSNRQRTVLFLDEIHRFNRAQQDVLLRDVEEGVLILIGATTENPFFSLNSPLISRSHIFELQPLTPEQIMQLLRRALSDRERGLGGLNAVCAEDALRFIAEQADGDARRALATLEVAVLSQRHSGQRPEVTLPVAADCMQRKTVPYDAAGDSHYDVVSAFIKSMRGSDPDAAL